MPTLFLSHSGPDKAAAIDLKRRLLASPDAQAAGLKVWLDVDDLVEGKPWRPQLEAAIDAASAFAVIVGSKGIRNWVRAETDLALSRAIRDESFRVIPILQDGGSENLTPFVKRYHAIRDPLNDPDALQRLLRAALGLDKDGLPVLTDDPFPGLRSMSEDWADRFFGRRTETDEVLALLRRHRAVTIVADSGAGKSSLAMAGVGHAWRGGALRTDRPRSDDTTIWHVVTMRPAENPVEQLRNAIQSAALQLGCDQAAIASLRQGLTSDPAFALRCGLDPASTHTLLIIDQAEELVTLTPRDRRPEFGCLIAALADAMGDRLRILITLRSDHLNLVGGVEGLGPMVRPSEAQFNLKQPVDLAEIVRGPLTLAGHRDEAEQQNLIDRLRKDLSNRPGDLALAQMTLSLAWRDRDKHGGLLGAYAMNGGALVALGREAERVERTLPPDDAARLMPIFIRLIRLSDVDTGATRRIAAREEFDDDQNRLIDRLAGEDYGRLVQTSAAHVEIAHEALITQWPRLHEYLIEHAGALRTLSDLMRRAQDWAAAAESTRHLTSLADEERFQALRQAQGAWLAPVERRFLDWSRAEHQRIQDEREKTARRIRSGISALAALLLALIGVGWFAYERDQSAQEQTAVAAQSRVDALALLARSQAETNPLDALKLVLGAWPEDGAGPFPNSSVAFRAITEALSRIRPHNLMIGHNDYITGSAFSRDGTRVVSSSIDNTLRVWDVETGSILATVFDAHEDGYFDGIASSVAFSPDGTQVVSGGNDGTLRIWDSWTGSPLYQSEEGHTGDILSVAYSPDGRVIASAGDDNTVRLWNVVDGLSTAGQPLFGHNGWVRSVAFSPDGRRLVSGSFDTTIRLWDASTGEPLSGPLRGHEGAVFNVTFSPDGRQVLSSGEDQVLRFWNGVTGHALGPPLRGHGGPVLSAAYSPDGRLIISGGSDGTLRVWNVENREALVDPLQGHRGGVTTVAFSADGSRFVTGGFDRLVRLWDGESGWTLGAPLYGHGGRVTSVSFSRDGDQIVSGSLDHSIRLWDDISGERRDIPMHGHEDGVLGVEFSPDDSLIASGGIDGTVRFWNVALATAQGIPLDRHQGGVRSFTFSADGNQIFVGGFDGTLAFWDVASGAPLRPPQLGHDGGFFYGGVRSVASSTDGSRIVSGGEDGVLRLWDAATGQLLGLPIRGHEGMVLSVTFSHDSQLIASGGEDGTVRLWDGRTGESLSEPMRGHENGFGGENGVNSVAFSKVSHRVISGGRDGTIRLWDTTTGASLGELMRGHWSEFGEDNEVRSVAFSPDGSHIVSGADDSTLRLWANLPPGNILQVACRYLPHINGRPDPSTDGLAAEIGIVGLTLPANCDNYRPPLPPEFRR